MAERKKSREPSRKKVILLLAAAGLPLFGILFSLSSFELRFINPRTNQQTVSLVALTLLVSLLFGALTFVLFRVEDFVVDALARQQLVQAFGFFDGRGADEHWPALLG